MKPTASQSVNASKSTAAQLCGRRPPKNVCELPGEQHSLLRRQIAAKDRDLSSMAFPDMVHMLHMTAEQFQAVTNTDVEAGQQLRAMGVVTWRPAPKKTALAAVRLYR